MSAMKLVRFAFAALGVLALVLLAIGNRTPVQLRLWPSELSLDLPLYGVFLSGFLLGAVIAAAALSLELLRLRIANRRLARRLHGYAYQERLRREAEEELVGGRSRSRGEEALALPHRS